VILLIILRFIVVHLLGVDQSEDEEKKYPDLNENKEADDVVSDRDLFVDWPEVEDAIPNLAIDTPERQKFVHQQHLQWATIYEYLKNQSAPAGMGVYERERFFRHANQLVLHDEILYYLRFPQKVSARLRDINPLPRVLCIPLQFRQEILKRLHDDPFSGHLTAHRTFSLAVTRFFWEGMYRDIEQYIRSCIQCQTRKVARRRPSVPVMALPVPSRPFERMSVDILGPITPISKQGHRYIIIFVDYFSRYVIAQPVKDADAKTTAKIFIDDVICKHGRPDTLLSDLGSNFMSKLMQEVLLMMNTKSLKTTAYHPRTNALVERFNNTLMDMLATLCNVIEDDRADVVQPAIFAYNVSTQATLEENPFFIVHGRDAVLPGEPIIKYMESHYGSTSQYINVMQHRISRTWELVKSTLTAARDEYLLRNTNITTIPL
jgi:transposase InsO family protein